MSFIGNLLKFASEQVGIKEETGHNDGQSLFPITGGREEPWCAHFVAWVFRSIKNPLPGDITPNKKIANPLANVSYMEGVFKDHGWFYIEPKPGDVVFFSTRGASDRGLGRHVGIVERIEGTENFTIEGNLSNSVRRSRHAINNSRITGYGRVPEKE
jgi:hypothetical protein